MLNELHAQMLQPVASQLAVALQNAHLSNQVRNGRLRLERLSRQLLDAQESERRYIARELHDAIGQSLTALKVDLQAIQHDSSFAAHSIQLAEPIRLVEDILGQVRTLSLELRPSLLDDLGLVAALRWHLKRIGQRGNLAIQFSANGISERLRLELETACFRLTQEALTNIVRHARASNVDVELRQQSPMLELTIRDDGIGFDADVAVQQAIAGSSMGLLGMQERAVLVGGQLSLESVVDRGTTIYGRFPLAPDARLERRQTRFNSNVDPYDAG